MPRKSSNSKPVSSLKHRDKRRIPTEWESWLKTGNYSPACKRRAVRNLKCLGRGEVRGYLSGLRLDPKLPPTDSLYPSVEHLKGQKNSRDVVVETRIVNDMKSHLSEKEFWQFIEHLFFVGREKGKIRSVSGKRLPKRWKPEKNYGKSNSERSQGWHKADRRSGRPRGSTNRYESARPVSRSSSGTSTARPGEGLPSSASAASDGIRT